MLLAVIDTETTGLDCTKDTITELAWALYDTTEKQVVASASFMFPTENVTPEITKITGITTETTKRAILVEQALALTTEALGRANVNAYVAHNASFDKGFVERLQAIPQKSWVCSYVDLVFDTKPGKLTHMCCDLGIPVSGAHRAINDVLMLCALLSKCNDLEDQVTKVLTYKKFMVIANVSFANNNLAKEMGCRWDPALKIWYKHFRAKDAAEAKATQWPCPVTIKEISE